MWTLLGDRGRFNCVGTMERSEEQRVAFKLFSVPSLSGVFETKGARVVVATGGGIK